MTRHSKPPVRSESPLLSMVLSARRKGGSVAAKADTSLPPDQELDLDQQKAFIHGLTLEGLELYERFLEDLNWLDLQGRLYQADLDEEGDGAEPAPCERAPPGLY